MEYVGIDLHKKESQIGLLTEAGDVMERRIRTEPQRGSGVKQLDNASIPVQLVQEFRSGTRRPTRDPPLHDITLSCRVTAGKSSLLSFRSAKITAIRLDGNRCGKPSPADCMSF